MAARRDIFFNPNVQPNSLPAPLSTTSFHQSLPGYQATPLVSLAGIASEIGVKGVYLKNESSRFQLPSFKILGASYGTVQALAQKFKLPPTSGFDAIKDALHDFNSPVVLFAATDGNHGRAVARMGRLLGTSVEIFVPKGLVHETIQFIRDEGANVTELHGNYDEAVTIAYEEAKKVDGVFVQDTAFPGYEQIPKWIVEGYSTMMNEIDIQLPDEAKANLVITPVGVGSLAQAVISHYKAVGRSTKVVTVEPDTAACLWKNLKSETLKTVDTYSTIMAGLNCGTVSSIAWPILKAGVDASATISDQECHDAVVYLEAQGIKAGPCGAAALAALRRLSTTNKATLGLNEHSTVVLLCTEGTREYDVPFPVSVNDSVALTQTLVQINSANPDGAGPGESKVAEYIAAWLQHRDIETHWVEPTPGRPSVIGFVKGSGGGKSLMFNGHIDTVTLNGYDGDPLSGTIKDGKLYGRGSADMKCGVAAQLIATAQAKTDKLAGDIIFAGVADEEALSIGTEDILKAGWKADGAVVCEPVGLEIIVAHKGFVWLEVDIFGVAAHGSQPALGVDSISKAGYFLVELDKLAQKLNECNHDEILGSPSVHASIIKGGEEPASYPANCKITIEYRMVNGETPDTVKGDIEDILKKLKTEVKDFSYDIHVTFSRMPFGISSDSPFVSLVSRHVEQAMHKKAQLGKGPFWTDCALLAEHGISTVLFGPNGYGLHSKTEWVEVDSIEMTTKVLIEVARDFCK